MAKIVEQLIEEVAAAHPQWDTQVLEALDGEKKRSEEVDAAFRAFHAAMRTLTQKIISGEVEEAAAKQAFENYQCKKRVVQYINRGLERYHAVDSLRALEKEDAYRAKKCVDQIWESYVFRFDPYFDAKENGYLEEEGYKSVAVQIDRITQVCVEYNLHLSAICQRIREEFGLSPMLCEHLAAKINEDLDRLKLTYILVNLREE